ncbi:MAG: signal peptidase I [Anaerolineaceae bacterium]|nr:signal peptidase I [Anaerolineaceae bacterium]
MFRQTSTILIFLILLGTLLLAIPGFPIQVQVVLSDSMVPTLRTGDLLFVNTAYRNIQPNTIISFYYGGRTITHRIVGVTGSRIITKGDNNNTIDPWDVNVADVIGSPVVRLPYAGLLLKFIRQPIGWLVLVVVPGGLLLLDEIRKIIKKKPDWKEFTSR